MNSTGGGTGEPKPHRHDHLLSLCFLCHRWNKPAGNICSVDGGGRISLLMRRGSCWPRRDSVTQNRWRFVGDWMSRHGDGGVSLLPRQGVERGVVLAGHHTSGARVRTGCSGMVALLHGLDLMLWSGKKLQVAPLHINNIFRKGGLKPRPLHHFDAWAQDWNSKYQNCIK